MAVVCLGCSEATQIKKWAFAEKLFAARRINNPARVPVVGNFRGLVLESSQGLDYHDSAITMALYNRGRQAVKYLSQGSVFYFR